MDTIDPLQFVFASLFVLGLLGVFALALKRFGQGAMLAKYNKEWRLNVLETRYIDGKTKLVLVKCDNAEHLLLLGDGKAMIIKSGDKKNEG